MRWFTECQSLPSGSSEEKPKSGRSNWREYEKDLKDPEGHWRGKIWVKRWSSNGWNDIEGVDPENLNHKRSEGMNNMQDGGRRGIKIGYPPFTGRDRQNSEPYLDSKQLGDSHIESREGDHGHGTGPANGETVGGDEPDLVKRGQLQSRNLVILDTILRSSYKAGYNDALKIRPFLPYSAVPGSSSSSPSSTSTVDLPSADNRSYVLLLGGLLVLGTGLITYTTFNRMKRIESGLKETLALVELRHNNDLSGCGKLRKDILAIKEIIERSKTELPPQKVMGSGESKGEESGLSLIKFDEVVENRYKSLQSDLLQYNQNITNSQDDLRTTVEDMKIDTKQEFRMIAKDFNGNQNDLFKMKTDLEVLQKSISTLSSSTTDIESGLEEIASKSSKESNHINDKLLNLDKVIGRDLLGEISLTNQFALKNSKYLEEIRTILQSLEINLLKEREPVKPKDKSSKSVGAKNKISSISGGMNSGEGSGSISSPPSPSSTSGNTSPSPYGSKLLNTLGLNLSPGLGNNDDIMPLHDIRKAIEGVKRSYLDNHDQSRSKDALSSSEIVAPGEEGGNKIGITNDTGKEDPSPPSSSTSTSVGGFGPTEGIKFNTPIDKVKNPYPKLPQSEQQSNIEKKEKDNSYKFVPTSRSSSTIRKNNKEDDDDGNTPPPPPPPPSSASGMSRSNSSPSSGSTPTPQSRPKSSHVNDHAHHWWTMHSLPNSGLGLNEIWKVKGFGWYHPHETSHPTPRNQNSEEVENNIHADRRENDKAKEKERKERMEGEEDAGDRSIGAWAVGRVRRRFGDWPFH